MTLQERLAYVLIEYRGYTPEEVVSALLRELEKTHVVLDPDNVTDEMLQACYTALPEHYDPPDPKRLPWHSFKARRRFTAMAKAAPKLSAK